MLKGNGSSAPTAITSTAGYNAYWSDANTLTGEQYVNVSRGGLGANMTAAGAGELVYSTSTTAYGHLAAGTSGQIIKSGGAGAPTWNTPSALTKTDDTNVILTLGGSASTALVNPASISVGWSGQLSLARGGTNKSLTASAGSVVYSDADSLELTGVGTAGQFLVSGGTGAPTWTSTVPATSLKWNALINPDGNLSLNHNEYTTTFTWDTASTAAAFTGLTLGLGNDATTDSTTQRILAVQNNLATGGTTENLLYLNNADDNVVGNAIEIGNTGTGGFTNFLDTPSLDISGTGAITGATGLSSSGTITFSGLTANRLVTTTTGGQLTTSAAGTAGQALLSGGTSAPSWGTLGLVYGGTNADLSGVATGGLIYKGASALAGTGALTGMLKGNGASAPTAITSTAGYNAYWSDANTLAGEQYVNVARGGLGANMTAAGAGELVYSTSATTYGHLAAGTSGQIIKSGGAGAPTWNTPSALTKTDDTNVILTLGGSASTALVNPASISVGWSGQLSLARGGTNKSLAASAGSVVYSDADSLELTGVGTAGQFLVSGGTGAPTWTSTIPATSLKWNALINPDGNLDRKSTRLNSSH
jgi:hypothetical protein